MCRHTGVHLLLLFLYFIFLFSRRFLRITRMRRVIAPLFLRRIIAGRRDEHTRAFTPRAQHRPRQRSVGIFVEAKFDLLHCRELHEKTAE